MEKQPSWSPLIFFTLAAGLFLFRIEYDFTVYNRGGTLEVYGEPPYRYLLHLPKGYTDFGPPRALLIFLHGAGEVNKELSLVGTMDPAFYARKAGEAENFPFIAVSPVTPTAGWEPDLVIEFLDRLLADRRFRFKIDPTRVYLTGFSMGGYGTFQTASRYPERFAAAVPLAGGCLPDDPETLRDIPIWTFHGDEDDLTSLEDTRKVIETLTALGNRDARLTELRGYGHGICENVYSRPELYRWMLQKRLPRRRDR